jgi:hypothetical protein
MASKLSCSAKNKQQPLRITSRIKVVNSEDSRKRSHERIGNGYNFTNRCRVALGPRGIGK